MSSRLFLLLDLLRNKLRERPAKTNVKLRAFILDVPPAPPPWPPPPPPAPAAAPVAPARPEGRERCSG